MNLHKITIKVSLTHRPTLISILWYTFISLQWQHQPSNYCNNDHLSTSCTELGGSWPPLPGRSLECRPLQSLAWASSWAVLGCCWRPGVAGSPDRLPGWWGRREAPGWSSLSWELQPDRREHVTYHLLISTLLPGIWSPGWESWWGC